MAEWTVIIKNVTPSTILINDLGLNIDGTEVLNLDNQLQYSEIADSDDLRTEVAAGNITVNNGIETLSAIDGVKYLRRQNIQDLEDNYYTKSELGVDSTVQLEWSNVINAPDFAADHTTQQGLIDQLETDMTAANVAIASLETDMTTANAGIASLETDMTTANAGIASLETDMTTANAAIASIETDQTTQDVAIASLETDMTTANAAIASIETDQTTQDAAIASLETDMTTANAAIAGKVSKSGDTMTGTLDMGANKITTSYIPTADVDLANKLYVDTRVQGLDTKDSVRIATIAPFSATYDNGLAGVGATLLLDTTNALSIDGNLTTVGDRILVKDQTDATENGIYVVTVVGGSGVQPELTRSVDFDNSPTSEVTANAYVFVELGTINADTGWTLSNHDATITIGTTNLSWVQFSSAGITTAGDGLQENGNIFSVKPDGTTISVSANGIKVDSVTMSRLDQVEIDATTANAGVASLETDMTTANAGIASLETDMTTANAAIASIETDQTTQDAAIASLETDMTTANAAIASIETDQTTQDAAIASLETDMTTANAAIASIETDQTTQDAAIASLESDITTISSELGNLIIAGGIVYGKDVSRSKWLGPIENYIYGRLGNVKKVYLSSSDGITSNNTGIRVHRAMTITSLSLQLETSGTCTLYIRKNGSATNLASIVLTASSGGHIDNINVDLAAGDMVQMYLFASLPVKNPIAKLTAAYNGGAV